MTDSQKKIVSLRISQKTIDEVKFKAGEDSLEYQFLQTLVQSNVPYSIMGQMMQVDQNLLRDCITYRRKFDDDLRERVCVKFKKVLEVALDEGLLPCGDVACVQPILTLTLRVMAAGVASK